MLLCPPTTGCTRPSVLPATEQHARGEFQRHSESAERTGGHQEGWLRQAHDRSGLRRSHMERWGVWGRMAWLLDFIGGKNLTVLVNSGDSVLATVLQDNFADLE